MPLSAATACGAMPTKSAVIRSTPYSPSGEISHVVRDGARWLIHTEDFDCFVIVNFAPGGLQSLRHLIDLYETARMVQSRWCLQ